MPLFKSIFTTIQRNEMFFANYARFPFTYYSPMFLDRSRQLFSLRRVETESRFFAYAVRITSMILRTARFLWEIYAEIFINATAGEGILIDPVYVSVISPRFWGAPGLASDHVNYDSSTRLHQSDEAWSTIFQPSASYPRPSTERQTRSGIALCRQKFCSHGTTKIGAPQASCLSYNKVNERKRNYDRWALEK